MPTFDSVLQRLRGEYREMPGLRLTAAQVQRLCGIEPAMCEAVLATLVETKFLCRTANGSFALAGDTDIVCRSGSAKADLTAPTWSRLRAS